MPSSFILIGGFTKTLKVTHLKNEGLGLQIMSNSNIKIA